MTRIQTFSRTQRRKWRKKLVVAMCVSMVAGGYDMYGRPVTIQKGDKKVTIIGCDNAYAAIQSGDPDINDSGEYEEVNISELTLNEENVRVYEIKQNGVYLLTGSNHDVDQDIYIPTQIVVDAGVHATIYMRDFEIQNTDGMESPLTGVVNKDATLPMIVNGDCTIMLLNDATLKVNTSNAAMKITQSGRVTLANSKHQLTLGIENLNSFSASKVLTIYGSMTVEGSHLKIDGNGTGIDFGNVVTHNDGTYREGKMIIHNGYIETKSLYNMTDSKSSPCFLIDGGQFSTDFNQSNALDELSTAKQCIINVSGLPENEAIDVVESYDLETGEILSLNTTSLRTDATGGMNINIINPDGRDITKLGILIKCGENYYKVAYSECNAYWLTLSTQPLEANDWYTVHYHDMQDQELQTVYTLVDENKKALLSMTEASGYQYSYYQTMSVNGEIYDGTLTTKDTTIYVNREAHNCNVTITGDQSIQEPMEYGTQLSNDYYYVTKNHKLIDTVTEDVVLTAYQKEFVDENEYFRIDSLQELIQFRELINNGYNKLNGYLAADIDTGENWDGIGVEKKLEHFETLNNAYQGIFEGNGHTVTLNIVETQSTSNRGFFGIVGQGAVIQNLYTTGSIRTNGWYVGGMIGCVNDSCKIINCGSNVTITEDAEAGSRFGGIIGYANNGNITVDNCYYCGSIVAEGKKLSRVGGIIGGSSSANVKVSNCFVDAEYNFIPLDNIENIGNCSGGSVVTNCYYVTPIGESTQGTKITKEQLASPKFTYELNTGNGTYSGAWALVKGENHPVPATATKAPSHKVDFSIPATIYGTQATTVSGYTYADGTVDLPDMSSYLQNNDQAVWNITGLGTLDENSVITQDYMAELNITYDRDNVLSLLQTTYDTTVEGNYTSTSLSAYQQVKEQVGEILDLEDNSSYTTEQLIQYVQDLKQAKENLVPYTPNPNPGSGSGSGSGYYPGTGDNSGTGAIPGDNLGKDNNAGNDLGQDTSSETTPVIQVSGNSSTLSNNKILLDTTIKKAKPNENGNQTAKTTIAVSTNTIETAVSGINLTKLQQVEMTIHVEDTSMNANNLQFNIAKDNIPLLIENNLGLILTMKDTSGDYLGKISVPAEQLKTLTDANVDMNIALEHKSVEDIATKKEKTCINTAISSNKGNVENAQIITATANPEYQGGLTVTTPVTGAVKGDIKYVYVYDKTTNKLKEIPNAKKTVSAAGTISIQASPNMDYVVSDTKLEGKSVVKLLDEVKVTSTKKISVSDTINVKVDLGDSIAKVSKFTKGDPYQKEEAIVTYKVAQPKLASISKDGKLKAKGKGTVTVYVTVKLENKDQKTYKMKVTIK